MERRKQRDHAGKVPTRQDKRLRFLLPLILAALALLLLIAIQLRHKAPLPADPNTSLPQSPSPVASLDDLLKLSPDELAQVDIALVNLLCATDLPGAENLDVRHCLETLDQWTARVRETTERHLYRVTDPRYADHYHHSEAYLRAEFLAQVLQTKCGVHYNMERVENIDFTNARDLFIHGMINDPNGGTCASMPVLYVAVGRRLGYPLKLGATRAHLFVRWDGPDERFNIETSGDGFSSFPDDYYKSWPLESTDDQIRKRGYLVSLSPVEELAQFMSLRGSCLTCNHRMEDAFNAYSVAHRYAPSNELYAVWAACTKSIVDASADASMETKSDKSLPSLKGR